MNFKLVLGGPGTGKTEALIRLVEREISAGLGPADIAFVSFTKAAVEEARTRAAVTVKLPARELTHFRTLHSLCFAQLGLRRGDVLEGSSMRELEKLTGERAGRDMIDADAGPWEIDQLARAVGQDPEEAATEAGISLPRFRRAVAARAIFKRDRSLLDFTDMLEQYVERGRPMNVQLAIIDEAQDLTPLQWRVVRRAFASTPRVIVAGDDDQAIHEWAGATIRPILEHRGEREVLSTSHRLSRQVHELATGVARQLSNRIEKETVPSDRDGTVAWYSEPTEVNLSTPGTWLLLARARYQLDDLVTTTRAAGVPYLLRGESSINHDLLDAAIKYEKVKKPGAPLWHDALTNFPLEEREYLLACRRGGERLNVKPRVSIDTVHGAKGRQADHVLLITDLTSRIFRRAESDPDAELRVLYVGLTRASSSLHIIQQRGPYAWQI